MSVASTRAESKLLAEVGVPLLAGAAHCHSSAEQQPALLVGDSALLCSQLLKSCRMCSPCALHSQAGQSTAGPPARRECRNSKSHFQSLPVAARK